MTKQINDVTSTIIGAAIAVHRELGPGLLESAYTACLAMELADTGLSFVREEPLPLLYRGRPAGLGYRVDLLVEDQVIVEVKSVERLGAIHGAQLLSYLRMSGRSVGLLINFNVKWLVKEGLHRVVNERPRIKA